MAATNERRVGMGGGGGRSRGTTLGCPSPTGDFHNVLPLKMLVGELVAFIHSDAYGLPLQKRGVSMKINFVYVIDMGIPLVRYMKKFMY